MDAKTKQLPGQKYYTAIKNTITKRPWLSAGIAALILLLATTQLRSIAIMFALVVIAALSKLTQEFFPPPLLLVFDLVTFTLVVVSFAVGALPALILTLVAQYAGLLARTMVSGKVAAETYALPAIGYILTAILMPFLLPLGIVTGGMIAVVFYTSLMMVAYWFLYKNVLAEITYAASVIPFNYWLLARFGETIVGLL